jgi:DNA-directed RNA polymerase sigma subunit (sigma70/sigma32)
MNKNREVFEENYAMTLKEIGEVLGVSRQTVRTIEQSALRKVREGFKKYKWLNLEEIERQK